MSEENALPAPSDTAAQEALVEAYLERYRENIQRQVERYNRRVKTEDRRPGTGVRVTED